MGYEWDRVKIGGEEVDVARWVERKPQLPGPNNVRERVARVLAIDASHVDVERREASGEVRVTVPASVPDAHATIAERVLLAELPLGLVISVRKRKPPEMKFNITVNGFDNARESIGKLREAMAKLAADGYGILPAETMCERVGLPPPVDPRTRREAQRREIDAVLCEDARRFPAFAVARKCAVMAAVEAWGDDGPVVRSATAMLGWLREYESLRGAFTKPNAPALNHARATFGEDALASYERARRLT